MTLKATRCTEGHSTVFGERSAEEIAGFPLIGELIRLGKAKHILAVHSIKALRSDAKRIERDELSREVREHKCGNDQQNRDDHHDVNH